MHTSTVSAFINGRFVAVIRDAQRHVVAYTLPSTDRNDAARAGLAVRSLVTHS